MQTYHKVFLDSSTDMAGLCHDSVELIMTSPSYLMIESNSPTKLLGSGMLPSNAYVTLEHEYILIFKKGGKSRHFPPKL